MTLPMPMKKLGCSGWALAQSLDGGRATEPKCTKGRQSIPECGSRGKHVLPYCPHDAVRACSEAEDGDGACWPRYL